MSRCTGWGSSLDNLDPLLILILVRILLHNAFFFQKKIIIVIIIKGKLVKTFAFSLRLRRGSWCRFWVDMGTADELALDVLINSLAQFSREYAGIARAVIGGVNADWADGTERTEPLMPKRAAIDPMRGSLPTDRCADENKLMIKILYVM